MDKDVLLAEALRIRCEALKAAMQAGNMPISVSSSFTAFDCQLAKLSDKLIGERKDAEE